MRIIKIVGIPSSCTTSWESGLAWLAAKTKKEVGFVRRKTGFLVSEPASNTVEVCAVFGEEAVQVVFDKEDLITLLTELP